MVRSFIAGILVTLGVFGISSETWPLCVIFEVVGITLLVQERA